MNALGVEHMNLTSGSYIISIIVSCIITSIFYNTDKTPKIKDFIYRLFLLDKFSQDSRKYSLSKTIMILYVFLICYSVAGFLTSINLNFKQVLIIGVLYPLGFRMFFNGSYQK